MDGWGGANWARRGGGGIRRNRRCLVVSAKDYDSVACNLVGAVIHGEEDYGGDTCHGA